MSTPITAPYAVLASRRPERPALAVVLGESGRPHTELLVVIDPTTGQAQAEYHRGDFEGHGIGTVALHQPSHRTFTAVGWLTVRGIDARTEVIESVEISLAVTWSRDPGTDGSHFDVVGTGLAYGSAIDSPTRLAALPDHAFNRYALDLSGTPERSGPAATALAA